MKITIKQLRQIVQETISQVSEAKDKELAIGDEVSVLVGNRPMKGKIVDKFPAKLVDPMAKGVHMPRQSGRMMWAVQIGTRTIQVPADEIEVIRSMRKSAYHPSSMPPAMNSSQPTTEATAVMGRSTMVHGSADDKDEEKQNDDILLDDQVRETDESKEGDVWNDGRYDFIARDLVFNWDDRSPEVNWKAVAKSYVNAVRSSTGKTLDPEKLHAALLKFLETDGDNRNQAILGGTHLYK